MENLLEAAKALVKFIEDEDVSDEISNDGEWRSDQFDKLINKVKAATAKTESLPDINAAQQLIRQCFATAIQTPGHSQ